MNVIKEQQRINQAEVSHYIALVLKPRGGFWGGEGGGNKEQRGKERAGSRPPEEWGEEGGWGGGGQGENIKAKNAVAIASCLSKYR